MPNGTPDVSGGGTVPLELEIPGVPAEATSFRALGETIVSFFSGLFGGGGSGFRVVQTEAQRDARVAEFNKRKAGTTTFPSFGPTTGADVTRIRSPLTGRVPIPTPSRGGPPLVTERFQDLPGPFVEPDLGIMPFELRGIPEPEPTEFIPFQPGPIPEPDVLEEEMAIDAPLLSGFGSALLPAVRGTVPATVGGLLGGFGSELLQGFLRAPQELGTGQIPQVSARVAGCPPAEKPSTRILRFIKANTGVSVKLSRAKSLIKELGLQNAARCLGINVSEACSLLIASSPRRRRGISGSDIRIVKRTARRFESLKHDLSHIGGRAAPHAHRRRRHHGAHSHK